MDFTIYRADLVGNKANCKYPIKEEVKSAEDLMNAVAFDHVCAAYDQNYRSVDNFLSSNVIVMDCDNDHSDDPDKWVTADKLDELMPNTAYAIAPSRHNMLPKGDESARPRFHVYFVTKEMTDAKAYAQLKVAIQKTYDFFDDNALDAARFIFGANMAEDDITWHDGWMNIEDDVVIEEVDEFEAMDDAVVHGPILKGSRNSTMSRFASRVLKRYGECDKAHEVFMEQANKCDPPLEEQELKTIWHSALKFYRNKVVGGSGYVPPSDYNNDFGSSNSLKPDDYSDVGEAKVLVREYGDELKFSAATDYLRYDGTVWRENKQMSIGAMEEFLDLQLQDAKDQVKAAKDALIKAGVPKDAISSGGKELAKAIPGGSEQLLIDLMIAEAYFKFVMKYRNYKNITATLNTAKPMVAIEVSDLDKNENLLNTPFATYHLASGMAGERPHDANDLITKITECSPGDMGEDKWLEALQTFFCGDQKLIDYVQQVVGMAAIGKVYQEHMIIAYGGGANGKSTFWNSIARVLGSYSGKLSAETLTFGCKRNVKPEMAELKGKRLIIASEMEEGMRLNTAVVKQLCSTDEVYAEKKYKDPFSFIPSHTLVLYTNHLPRVSANDDGIWRRLIVIPFNAHITGKSDIKNYADYLFENAGPAILKWIIEGAQIAINNDFKTALPACVADAVNKYREDNDWLGQFINDCCDVDPSYVEKSGELYQQYRAYCIQNGEYVRSTTDFYHAADKAGYYKRKTNQGVMVHGLQLKAGQDFLD